MLHIILGKKNGHFSFLCFYFYMHWLYFPFLYQMFCSFFHMLFYFSNPEPEKRAGFWPQKRRRLDSSASFRSTQSFSRRFFEPRKVIFALHDTKWLSLMFKSNISHQQHLYIMSIFLSIAISMMYILYYIQYDFKILICIPTATEIHFLLWL